MPLAQCLQVPRNDPVRERCSVRLCYVRNLPDDLKRPAKGPVAAGRATAAVHKEAPIANCVACILLCWQDCCQVLCSCRGIECLLTCTVHVPADLHRAAPFTAFQLKTACLCSLKHMLKVNRSLCDEIADRSYRCPCMHHVHSKLLFCDTSIDAYMYITWAACWTSVSLVRSTIQCLHQVCTRFFRG